MARLAKVCVVLNSFLIGFVSAQSPSGALRGNVQDSHGSRVASAFVTIRSLSASQSRTLACDSRGEFRFDALAPGEWRITVSAQGFAEADAQVLTAVGAVRDVVITMKPASDSQMTRISAHGSSIATQPMDAATQIHQGIVTRQDLETMPLAGRSFANIAYLAPGTEPVEPSDPTKARITAVSTGGSSGLNNELSVDGADDSDDYIGGFLQNFSPDVIQEFSVRTAQEDADTGGTTAGSIVITTRSGGNDWHAEAAVYERATRLNARSPIDNPEPDPKQPFSRQNYVGTVGGPVVKNRVWSFTSYEQVHEKASVAYSPASLEQFKALADLVSRGLIPGLNSIAVPNVVPVPFRDFLASQRLDWAQSSRSSWFLRGSVDSYTTHNNLVAQGTLPSTGLLTHNNYMNLVAGHQYLFSPAWLGQFILSAGGLHLTQTRNSDYGFALAFPFSSTALTISGFETFGDNQFATPITFFPSQRNQQKYQLRVDMNGELPGHALKFGANIIHEPVLGGSFPGNAETLYTFPQDPSFYLGHPYEFATDLADGAASSTLGGGFSQNIQRVAVYAQDSWRVSPRFTLNYGLRWSGTWGLFTASGRSQAQNPGYLTLNALGIPLVSGVPRDNHHQFGPRLGLLWSLGAHANTVLRAGFGLFYSDLAQTGWVAALQTVNSIQPPCANPLVNPGGPKNSGCVPGSLSGGTADVIDGRYRTPYALHASAGFEHAFGEHWLIGADYTHEQGNHGYRAYSYVGGVNLFTPLLPVTDPAQAAFVPDVNVFHSDNRSSYDALMVHVQANWARRVALTANYVLAKAQTWGCVLGELSDYVNGVCNPLHAFASGDYGPSGEDNRHRATLGLRWRAPGKVEFSTLTQAESPRPFTITTADESGRIAINGAPTSLDQFRGTAYIQADVRISRPIDIGEHWTLMPFAEAFNIVNRNNPGANFITNIAALPVPPDEASVGNITHVCLDADCDSTEPIRSLKQVEIPAGAFGDFFGPGTTVGMPFALQIGFRVSF
jgi:Carboxypeptidase regulatory-like domain/TonB dependent receptor